MALTREQALAALGLASAPSTDAAAVQAAFERLARRYPQPHFPDRFRVLLEARDQLLAPERAWREMLESRTLNLAWILPHLTPGAPGAAAAAPDRRTSLQNLLRAGFLAEPIEVTLGGWEFDDDDDDDDDKFF